MKKKTTLGIPVSLIISYFSRDTYKDYMKILENSDILTRVPYPDGKYYKVGERSLLYRVHNSYLETQDMAIVVLEDDRASLEIENEIDGINTKYLNTIKKLEINVPQAIAAEIQHYHDEGISFHRLKTRIGRVLQTKRKRYIKKGKKVNRIYHSFTNVSRVSRKHFNLSMKDIDIVNAQPLLLVAELKRTGMLYDDQYQLDCEEGVFYERFFDLYAKRNLSEEERRDKTKKSLYACIFFGFVGDSKSNKRFKELYPVTWASLKTISESSTPLASRLQNLEAELFNNLVPSKSKYYFTLFDAIYYSDHTDTAKLTNTIKDFFGKYQIRVTTK